MKGTEKYIDSEGRVHDSINAYFNSPDLDPYQVMLYLHSGTRTPQNENERHLLEEMKEIEQNGGTLDFTEGSW